MQIKKAEEKRIALHIKEDLKLHTIKNEHLTIKNVSEMGFKSATDQIDGGEELRNAAITEYMLAKPVLSTTTKGATGIKAKIKKDKENRKENDKRKKTGDERSSQNNSSEKQKDSKRSSSKKEDKKTSKKSLDDGNKPKGKKRKIGLIQKARAFLIHNLFRNKQQKEQGENQEMPSIVGSVAPWLGLLGIGLLLVAAVVVPVMAVIAIMYNSPFAIFMPPLESGDTVLTVTSAYVAEFNAEVNNHVSEHSGYDLGEIVYVEYEGTSVPNNYYGIIAVYMVRYGIGDAATVINDTTRGWIKSVVDDMCSYTLSSGSETITNEAGVSETKTVLYVNVTLKNFREMISVYAFDDNEQELLYALMASENLTLLGYVSGGESLSPTLTGAEIRAILNGITDTKQYAACSFALSKVGYPYSQTYRDSGNYYDCSSLVYYSWKDAGVNISYGGAYSAAAEAQGLEVKGQTVAYDAMQPGDLIFYSYCKNGRYKNISHVAIYVGNGKVVEAKNEQYGVVYGDVPSPGSIVLIGRPQ